jgi:hypothetical protein
MVQVSFAKKEEDMVQAHGHQNDPKENFNI